jgi:transcriptional regulator with XRE-family HTH domain
MGVQGDRLRAARERKGWTQDELAERVGRHRASISNWESGTPPRNTLGRLREVLDLDERLLPLGSPLSTRPADMTTRELIAKHNETIAILNSLTIELIHRLQAAEADAVRFKSKPLTVSEVRPKQTPPRHAHESASAVFYQSLSPDETANGYTEQSNE